MIFTFFCENWHSYNFVSIFFNCLSSVGYKDFFTGLWFWLFETPYLPHIVPGLHFLPPAVIVQLKKYMLLVPTLASIISNQDKPDTMLSTSTVYWTMLTYDLFLIIGRLGGAGSPLSPKDSSPNSPMSSFDAPVMFSMSSSDVGGWPSPSVSTKYFAGAFCTSIKHQT